MIIDEITRRRTTAWIWLGIYALLAAGILSLLLAFARTPVIQDFLPGRDFFHVALVAHVDLSVLVWFMACTGMTWTLFSTRQSVWNLLALWLAVAGTVMISMAPFVGATMPLMNNYVPVLQHGWFYLGLGVLASGLVVQAVCYLCYSRISFKKPDYRDLIRFALAMAALSSLLAVACVGWSYLHVPKALEGKLYFEYLFWGGGHVQQFTDTVLALVAWILLAGASGSRLGLKPGLGMVLFALVVLPLLIVPWIYRFPVASGQSILAFTDLMRWGGLAAVPLCLIVFTAFFNRVHSDTHLKPLRAVLLCSFTLFAAGGLLGFMIRGSNTVIPAHYHGSIVGVTLAFMGVVYYVLPRLGFALKHKRLLNWQPYIYSGGQLLHITGLAVSGGYGVQRKVAGADQALQGLSQTLAMGMMGLGGLLAAIGGLCFLIIAIAALRSGNRTKPAPVIDTELWWRADRSL